MRIGILSDTHGTIPQQVYTFFAECDELWHAGDIGIDVLDKLREFKPVVAVFGNMDCSDMHHLLPQTQLFQREGHKIIMTHIGGYPGHYARSHTGTTHPRRPPERPRNLRIRQILDSVSPSRHHPTPPHFLHTSSFPRAKTTPSARETSVFPLHLRHTNTGRCPLVVQLLSSCCPFVTGQQLDNNWTTSGQRPKMVLQHIENKTVIIWCEYYALFIDFQSNNPKGDLLPQFHHRESLFHSRGRMKKIFSSCIILGV